MKAKILRWEHSDKSGNGVSRIYFEPDFEQAEKDLNLIKQHTDVDYILEDIEIYNDKNYTLDKAKKLTAIDVILEKRLTDFDELSVRALNTLRVIEVYTVKELLKFSEKTLMKQRFMGKRTMNELKGFLEKYNLKLPENNL